MSQFEPICVEVQEAFIRPMTRGREQNEKKDRTVDARSGGQVGEAEVGDHEPGQDKI